jgi:ribonuclease D
MSDEPVVEQELPTAIAVNAPREGLPATITTQSQLSELIHAIRQGTGPVALDAERASGFKYSQRAYLIQIRRTGSGSHLIDPMHFPDLAQLQDALEGVDWILHAASQDLVCLAEVGLRPTASLFDTELAGRLLGFPRVGLGAMIESQLGYALAKEHSAADWSTRPLPESWLNYAALDVEFLIELWELLEQQLRNLERFDWAMQEFVHVKTTTSVIERIDPWRRTSGMHAVRKPRELAVIREVWQARDHLARERDTAAGRILSDSHIVTLAASGFSKPSELRQLSFMHLRNVKRNADVWIEATVAAHALAESELPPLKLPNSAPPPPRNWEVRNPEAWKRLEYARSEVSKAAEKLAMPVENLMTPDTIRRILWSPPETSSEVSTSLRELGAREWQIDLVGPIIQTAIFDRPVQTTKSEAVPETMGLQAKTATEL